MLRKLVQSLVSSSLCNKPLPHCRKALTKKQNSTSHVIYHSFLFLILCQGLTLSNIQEDSPQIPQHPYRSMRYVLTLSTCFAGFVSKAPPVTKLLDLRGFAFLRTVGVIKLKQTNTTKRFFYFLQTNVHLKDSCFDTSHNTMFWYSMISMVSSMQETCRTKYVSSFIIIPSSIKSTFMFPT